MRRRLTPSSRVAWLLPTLSAVALLACNPPKLDQDGDGFTELTGDCDDLDANVHPEAQEVCYNGIDDNCNGVEDEEGATSGRVWYIDLDGDGYGKEEVSLLACEQPEGYAAEKWDCQEDNAAIHPGAAEVCDRVDNDCDTQVDEDTSTDAVTWHPDGDGDGYGDAERVRVSCEPPGEGWINDGSDCADGDPLVSPEQTESCVTPYDDDCDGTTNTEGAFACTTFYGDLDGDGFAGTAACLCEAEAPYTEREAADCDDTDSSVYPGGGSVDTAWSDRDCDGRVERSLAEADHRLETSVYKVDNVLAHHLYGGIDHADLDADGLQDIGLGVGDGKIYVVGGSELLELHALQTRATATIAGTGVTVTTGEEVGRAVGWYRPFMADLNQDGFADLVATQIVYSDAGDFYEALTFLGPLSGEYTVDDADAAMQVPLVNSARGLAPGHAGALSDGRPMLGYIDRDASTEFLSGAGSVRYFAWDAEAAELVLEGIDYGGAGQGYAENLTSAGDLNGDGSIDRVLSDDSEKTAEVYGAVSSRQGSIDLYTDVGTFAETTIVSNAAYAYIGGELGGPGDLNGDGHPDIVVSGEASSLGFPDAGRVHVLWGPFPEGVWDIVDLPQAIFHGNEDGAKLDRARVAPDVDGDGRDDLLMGAPGASNHLDASGEVYLWHGSALEGTFEVGTQMVTLAGNGPTSRISPATTFLGLGDVDGDGLGDFMLEATLDETLDPEQTDNLFFFFGGVR